MSGERELKRSITLPILTSIMILLMILALRETLFLENSLQFVSAIATTNDIGVYWSPNCIDHVKSIDWGVLSPGEAKSIKVYVRNQGNTTISLLLTTANWDPEEASEYLKFSCPHNRETIEAKKVAEVTLTLLVDPNTRNIYNFGFDLVFEGTPLLTDLNKDGKVDLCDIMIVAIAFGSKPGDENWNEIADLDKNGKIDISDVAMVARDYGKLV